MTQVKTKRDSGFVWFPGSIFIFQGVNDSQRTLRVQTEKMSRFFSGSNQTVWIQQFARNPTSQRHQPHHPAGEVVTEWPIGMIGPRPARPWFFVALTAA